MCGFIQSTFVTVPVNVIGLFRSNSADTAWCANAGIAAASRAEPKMKTPMRFRAIDPPINLNIAIETRLLTPVPLKSSPLSPDLLQRLLLAVRERRLTIQHEHQQLGRDRWRTRRRYRRGSGC